MTVEIETLGRQMSRAIRPFLYLYTADEDVSALRVVRLSAAGHVLIARPPEVQAREPLGVAVTGTSIGDEVVVRAGGELIDASWSWTLGAPVLLGTNGVLTQTQPPGQAYLVRIGTAVAADTIVINIFPALVTA